TIDEETSNSDTFAVNGRHAEDVAALSTQELKQAKEVEMAKTSDTTEVHGKQAEDVAALSTQELAPAAKVELVKTSDASVENEEKSEDVAEVSTQVLAQTGEPEDVAALSTQGLIHAEDTEPVEDTTPDVPEVSEETSVPPGFNEADIVQSPQPSPVSPAPKGRRGFATRWIILAVVCLLVLASIVGGLLFFLHSQGTVATGTPAVEISPTSSNLSGITPVATTRTNTTPVVGSTAIFNITFSGAVQGTMTVTSITRCGVSTTGTEYDLYFSGTVGDIKYNFVSRIPAYKGPATYNTGQISVVFAQQPLSSTTIWGNVGNVPATATINSDVKSGSLDITLTGATKPVHVAGNWVCE
ncbi:MAG TPA: hypothetical protein VIY29_15785, partial [Ktedonobacteraceae bacterium]